MPLDGVSSRTPVQNTSAPQQSSAKPKENVGTASSDSSAHPQLGALQRPPHSVGQVQDMAKKVFSFTTGVSPKVVNESGGAQGQALRKLPATAENMAKLSAFEHAAANGPGAATSADKIAAAAGFARNGAAHTAASTAALGAGGLRGAHAAGYLPDHIENISSNFS
ncbi:hypothetical protein PQR14_13060 [Paraburkholderia bryophila]|uniref:hypothetical protein n=1 Tax=Burkholderiaceae TaxID=119060 RepID=UPI00054E4CB4|nr:MULTISPECIES: hypothetical protein [Burkholderiaceae]